MLYVARCGDTPMKEVLAGNQCYVIEGIWLGQSEFTIPVINWGIQTLVLEKGV